MAGEKFTKTFKILLLGNTQVGKSRILTHYIGFGYTDEPTVGPDFFNKNITIDDQVVRLQVWDTGGRVQFESIIDPFLRGADLISIVLDGSQDIDKAAIEKDLQRIKKVEPDAQIHFLVNKIDKPEFKGKAYFTDELAKILEMAETPVSFCSGKTGEGVAEAFEEMAIAAYQKPEKEKPVYAGNAGGSKPEKKEKESVPPQETNPHLLRQVWARGNLALIAVSLIALMILSSPVGAGLVVGGLSALAVAGIVGGAVLVLWNIACAIGSFVSSEPPSTIPDVPPEKTVRELGDPPTVATPSPSQVHSPVNTAPKETPKPPEGGGTPPTETPGKQL